METRDEHCPSNLEGQFDVKFKLAARFTIEHEMETGAAAGSLVASLVARPVLWAARGRW